MPDITGEVLPELEIESADIAVSIKGDKGDPGNDGHTPVITATKLDGVTTIFVDGNPVATVQDGINGVSPVITATKSGNTLTIYANGVVIGRVQDGEDIRGGKTELRYSGTGNVITRSSDGGSVSFRQILEYLRVSPDFTYLLYGERAYLPTLINDDDQGMHYVYFESTMVDGGMSKNAVIRIVSNDGETIAGISTSNVANENYNNKVAQITAQNKASTGSYTSVKAVVDYVESEALLGEVDMSRGEEIPHAGYDDTEIRQELSRQSESITEIKDNFAKKTDIPTVPTQVSQLENDAGYLTEHQDISGKQDKLTAGSNITIDGNVISATGGGVESDWEYLGEIITTDPIQETTTIVAFDGKQYKEVFITCKCATNGVGDADLVYYPQIDGKIPSWNTTCANGIRGTTAGYTGFYFNSILKFGLSSTLASNTISSWVSPRVHAIASKGIGAWYDTTGYVESIAIKSGTAGRPLASGSKFWVYAR